MNKPLAVYTVLCLAFSFSVAMVVVSYLQGRPQEIRVYIDEGTGCQYLGQGSVTLLPRYDANGKHMCGRPAASTRKETHA